MKTPKFSAIAKKVRNVLKKKQVAIPLVVVLLLFLLYNGFVNHNEPTQLGIARNLVTGEMWLQEGGGFFVTPPWVWVARVDTRPMRVSVTSGGRGYSAKLVQFDKDHWEEFVATEGWRYYWWSNRISFNLGYDEEYRGMKDIMRGYAYSARKYPFIVVLEEYESK